MFTGGGNEVFVRVSVYCEIAGEKQEKNKDRKK